MAGDFYALYKQLMSASPQTQSVSAVAWGNLATVAQANAATMRTQGAAANQNAGTSGAAAQAEIERHAQWFDSVATDASRFSDQMHHAVSVGLTSQTTAEEWKARVDQEWANYNTGAQADGPPKGAMSTERAGATALQSSVNEWGTAYGQMQPPTPSAPPGGSSGGDGGGSGSTPASSGGGSGSDYHGEISGLGSGPQSGSESLVEQTPQPVPIQSGGPGSITVGSDNGDFAGWFKDPRTGYYVDPSTGREFDPTTSRWIDPVTGLPFGDATQYATKLEGLGGPSVTGGLLSGGPAGVGGAGWSNLFSGGMGNTGGLSASFGGFMPPSMLSSNPAYRTSYAAARDNMAVKSAMASRMLAREEATRTGRPYMPPMQSAAGAGAGRGRGRASGLTAEEPLFSNAASRAAARRAAAAKGGAFSEAESATSAAGARRSYLPPTQAGGAGGKGEKDKGDGRDRPDWLVEDDLWGSPSGAPVILDGRS